MLQLVYPRTQLLCLFLTRGTELDGDGMCECRRVQIHARRAVARLSFGLVPLRIVAVRLAAHQPCRPMRTLSSVNSGKTNETVISAVAPIGLAV